MLLLLLLSGALLAFGFIGHELVARLAWDLLAPPTRHRLGFRGAEQVRFVKLACRPDRIKHRPGMAWAMPLHFYNTPDSPPEHCQRLRLDPDAAPNLLQATLNYTTQLGRALAHGRRLPPHAQVHVLSYLVHFMTDLHQPLHLCAQLQGGNRLRVRFEGRRTTLHSLWDTRLLRTLVRETPYRRLRVLVRSRCRGRLACRGHAQCIERWASQTNAVNCRCVWRNVGTRSDLVSTYYAAVRPALVALVARAAHRTARLLTALCAAEG